MGPRLEAFLTSLRGRERDEHVVAIANGAHGVQWTIRLLSIAGERSKVLEEITADDGEIAVVKERIRQSGLPVGAFHRNHAGLFWTATPARFALWSSDRLALDAQAGRIRLLAEGLSLAVAEIEGVEPYVSSSWFERGVRLLRRSAGPLTVASSTSVVAEVDPTYDDDLLEMDTAWARFLARSLADWMEVRYVAPRWADTPRFDETLHICQGSGYLVGPEGHLADDPAEFYSGEEAIVLGCAHMSCDACNEIVRFERDPLPEGRTGDTFGLFGQRYRVYQCGCESHREDGVRMPRDEDAFESALPWKCVGHPIATVPFELDGERISRDTDFGELVRRTLAGSCPESARPEERRSPVGWIIKLYVRLLDTGVEDAVSRAAATCITDPDPRVRAAALGFLAAFPEAAGAERAEEIVAGDRSLFEGVPDPTGSASATIEVRLLRLLGRRLLARDTNWRVKAQRALDLAKAEVLRPGKRWALFPFLAIAEPGWLAENAEAIGRADPEASSWLTSALSTRA